jgi:TolA-binding protein
MRRSENIILLICLLCTLVACKTVPAEPVVTYTQEAIETSAETVQETAIDLSGIIAQVETTGSVTKEQIQALSSKTTALVSQTETLVKIVQTQTENIKAMQAQNTAEISRLKQENEKALLVQYDELALVKSELSAVTAERDRAISKLKPWKNTAIVLIIVFIVLLGLTIAKIVIKYMA